MIPSTQRMEPKEPKRYASGPSGKHQKPTIAFRPEPEELDAINRAVAARRDEPTRNDWLREAVNEKLEREAKKKK